MEKWYDMTSQDVVDIMHWNCLAWQQSTSSVTHFSTPNHETAPTKSIPFQHVTIPWTFVCAFYHQHCWVQIGFRHWTKLCSSWHTARWNGVYPIAHRQACDVSSLSDLLRAVRTDEIVILFSADGYGSFWQIIHNVWQKLPRSRGHSAKPAWPLGRELCQYEHNVSSNTSHSQTLTITFARSIPIPLFLCPSEGPSIMYVSTKIKKWVGGWMNVDFPKKSNVLVQKQKCGISNDVFSCGSGTVEIQVTVYCETEELQITDCSVCESRTAELRDIVYSLCGSETAELQVTGYSLCGGESARLKVKALV